MKKNVERLLEQIEILLSCSKCKKRFGGYGTEDYFVAEEASNEGWVVNNRGDVICATCSKKKTRRTKCEPKENRREASDLEAIKRVLLLVDGYLSAKKQDVLMAWNGGMMTMGELRNHIKSALNLDTMKRTDAEP